MLNISKKPLQCTSSLHLIIDFHWLCRLTAYVPLSGLLICFITAYISYADTICNTFCKVDNFIPSISAITGVSPQRYLWRICIAFHVGPRLLVAYVFKQYYENLSTVVSDKNKTLFNCLIFISFWLNLTELMTVVGVTYVSNKENYPVHEKIFIVFMCASILCMLSTLCLVCVAKKEFSAEEYNPSIKIKLYLFIITILSTIGLLYFFFRHRFYCEAGAFSWFSFSEYCIAVSNMLFHMSVVWDFSDLCISIYDKTVLKPPVDEKVKRV